MADLARIDFDFSTSLLSRTSIISLCTLPASSNFRCRNSMILSLTALTVLLASSSRSSPRTTGHRSFNLLHPLITSFSFCVSSSFSCACVSLFPCPFPADDFVDFAGLGSRKREVLGSAVEVSSC